MRRFGVGASLLFLLSHQTASAFLGTELGPLLQLVSGQVTEIEKLSETLGAAKAQTEYLKALNQGVERTVAQIRAIQAIIDRAQGLDPREVRSIADLNELLARAKTAQASIGEILGIKIQVADQAIARGALQSDTSYRMGQEMVSAGAQLAQESQTASPGRAAQISAAADSAQMLSQGVELQTLSQMVQLQALLLEFQKSLVERDLQTDRFRRQQYGRQLAIASRRPKP